MILAYPTSRFEWNRLFICRIRIRCKIKVVSEKVGVFGEGIHDVDPGGTKSSAGVDSRLLSLFNLFGSDA
jgi:hypothetical protein